MDILDKAMVVHKLIIGEVSASMVFTAGTVYSGWDKNDHIQHTSDSIEGHVRLFSNQVDIITNEIENNTFDNEKISKYLTAYKNDRQKLKFNIENDKIDKALFNPIKEHIESLNEIISTFEYILGILGR